MATEDRSCSIHPYFEIHEGRVDDFKALCERFIEATEKEAGCLYYGFSFDGRTMHCREAYTDALGLLKHLENVGPLLKEALEMSDLTRVEVHGPTDELDLLRGPLAELGPRFFELEYGFRA